MKAIRTIFALSYALILLAGFGFVAMLFYSSMNPPWDAGEHIETHSNTYWSPHPFDVDPGMHAVYLQG